MELVSIIIPVYNAENYLCKCIESILNQTYQNMEIILVDDGSTDKSYSICNQYAKSNDCIKVLQQENSGPSVARNKGMDVVKGKYVQFVDSDDSMDPDMINNLVNSMGTLVQLSICGYKLIQINEGDTYIRKIAPFNQGIFPNSEFIKSFGKYFENGFINPLWNKLYRSDIIKQFNLRFIEGVNMGEDLLFNLDYIRVCKNISIIKDPLYNYLSFNNSSLTGSFKKNFFGNQQMLFQEVRNFLLENNSYDERNKDFVEVAYTNSVMSCINNLFHRDSCMNSKIRKEQIYNIIFNYCVRKNIIYFKKGSIQKRVIGYLVESKSIKSIYLFFKIKSYLRYMLGYIHNSLKL